MAKQAPDTDKGRDTSPLQDTLKDPSERQDPNHWSADPEMPPLNRVDRRIRWPTISKAADRSSKISNEDPEATLASLRASTTESKEVSVECPLPKPDWLLSRRLFCARKAETWLNTTHSSVFAMKGRRETGL